MKKEIEPIDISTAEIKSKLQELERSSKDRAILRMLSAGVRLQEIAQISDLTGSQIRYKLDELFPEKDIAPSDFRKLLGSEIMRASEDKYLTQYVLDHMSVRTSKAHQKTETNEVKLKIHYKEVSPAKFHNNCGGIVKGKEGEEGFCKSCESRGIIEKEGDSNE